MRYKEAEEGGLGCQGVAISFIMGVGTNGWHRPTMPPGRPPVFGRSPALLLLLSVVIS